MVRTSTLYVVTIGAHVGMLVGAGVLRDQPARVATSITVSEAKKAPPPKPPDPLPPKNDPPPPPRPAAHVARAEPKAEPAPAPASAPLADLTPDFGVALSNDGPGLAVGPVAAAALAERTDVAPVVKRARVLAPAPKTDTCDEAPSKPRPVDMPKPKYTAEAQAASIEGKVRLEVTIDEHGRVTNVRVIKGLGHGLDEAAIAAIRAATFEPAVACGKPVTTTITIGTLFTVPP